MGAADTELCSGAGANTGGGSGAGAAFAEEAFLFSLLLGEHVRRGLDMGSEVVLAEKRVHPPCRSTLSISKQTYSTTCQ